MSRRQTLIPKWTYLPVYGCPWETYERTTSYHFDPFIFFTNACVLYINAHFEVCMPTVYYLPSEFHFWKHVDTIFNLYLSRLHRHSKAFCIYRHFFQTFWQVTTNIFLQSWVHPHAVYLKFLFRIFLGTLLWPLVSELHVHQKLV